MPAPRISVALATYNGATYLEQQLDSLAAQRCRPFEVVVSDDCSTDGTIDLLSAFADRAPFPVRIGVNDAQLGWRANFIRAAGRCSGDLVAFCDQDDVWYPDKLERVGVPFDDPDVTLVHHNADLIDADGKPYGTLAPVESEPRRIGALSRPTDWSNPLGLVMVFRRWLVRYADLWAGSADLFAAGQPAAHDQWFYFLATNLGDVVSLPERLLGYRQHGKNSVGWSTATHATSVLEDPGATRRRLDRTIGMLEPFCRALRAAEKRETAEASARLQKALAANDAYLARLKERRVFYAAPHLAHRLSSLARLLRDRAYDQRDHWGFGRRALVSDLTRGLLRGTA